MIKGEGLRF